MPTRIASRNTYQLLLIHGGYDLVWLDPPARRWSQSQFGYSLIVQVSRGRHAFTLYHSDTEVSEVLCHRGFVALNSVAACSITPRSEPDSIPPVYLGHVRVHANLESESLSSREYNETLADLITHGEAHRAQIAVWLDCHGKNVSIVLVRMLRREVQAEAYHLSASTGLVIRTQTNYALA